jgi:hypothetical protein
MAVRRPPLFRVPGGVSGRREPPAADEMHDLLEKWASESERVREATPRVRLSPLGEPAAQPGGTGEKGDAGA